ncbi:peptide transport protein PTR2 [Eremomyces bilateralis CBS 781.70]|uniref:Peptide transport protein PTR2 n=1 Tax=Eremomyces bilateralis CBS 781.70 TaxID=1392243 RepID=A0A6G1GFP3_9PEZI|nr:peptide transport protein PTR2 [Eremomyces bilateralis CBS 781.70]KAF1816925.1 peptide transport protein PTR2 [Eremomyces bilateralis CBS 781.70]
MAFDATAEAPDIAKAQVKGLGDPTPPLEKKQDEVAFPEPLSDDDSGYVLPTEEEIETLRRVPGRIPWIAFTVTFVELCERFAYYGTTAVLVNFVQRPLPEGSTTGNDPRDDGRPGALNYGQRASTGLVLFNRFWSYFTPLFGGYIADSKWGKIKTIQMSIACAMFGHVIIIISAIPQVIKNPTGAMGCLAVGLVFFGTGVGGFKPNVSPLMVDQLKSKPMHIKTLATGERVIVDPAVTTQRIFMYFYMFINVGSITGQVSMVYAERYVGFWLSYLLPTIMFALCPIVLAVFNNRYVNKPPTGSVLGKSARLMKYAMRGKVSPNPVTTARNFNSGTFWEDVKPSRVVNKPKWMTFDDAWVDEVARGVKACGVFIFYPLFWLAYNQIDGNLVSQAATMSLHGAPNDLINNMNPLGIIIMIPILDQLIYPALRKMKIRFTPLRRMCAGFFVACSAMIWAAVVQHYIYKTGACGKYMNTCDEPAAPINVWSQTGAYVLVGLAEIFASITGLEYAYTKAPANMKGMVFGFYHFSQAVSSAIGQAFTALSEDPLLEWNYGSVAIIAFCGGVAFWWFFHKLDAEEEALNLLPESTYQGKNLGAKDKLGDEEARDQENFEQARNQGDFEKAELGGGEVRELGGGEVRELAGGEVTEINELPAKRAA